MREGTTVGERADDVEPGASLEELYVRHAPEAIRLAYLITHDAAFAEDVAQEAFVRVAGRFRHLRSFDTFDAYLRRTVVNLCRSHFRRQKVARAYLARTRAGPITSAALPDLETRDELRSALAALPERQRAALVLRFYLDLSEERTADTLGCSVPAARSLVFRAMATLREQIGDEEQ